MDMDFIKTRFLSYQNIKSWCEKYAKENNSKLKVEIIDHKKHKEISLNDIDVMLYKEAIPAYRNTYNLRSFTKEKATFYLTVKGFSVVINCHFISNPIRISNEYEMEPDGQLKFIF